MERFKQLLKEAKTSWDDTPKEPTRQVFVDGHWQVVKPHSPITLEEQILSSWESSAVGNDLPGAGYWSYMGATISVSIGQHEPGEKFDTVVIDTTASMITLVRGKKEEHYALAMSVGAKLS
jgi:hypothetical protein